MAVVCHHCGAPGNDADRFCRRCGASVSTTEADVKADPLVGRTVGGGYTLQELVGVGGMGRVYRAEQTALGRTVAAKVIHPHLLGDEQTVARFYTEARASSRLNHPNSVSIIDFGRTDDGILYLVMEFLQGKDLAMVMHEEGPLPFKRISEALVAVLGALGEAHALGVVHRDLKPENIIINRFRSGADLVKVVDFGLATIVSGPGSTSITTPGLVCGTPDYMSPEQGKGETVDGRGDLYSLGVVLYELLTDELPYEDETPTKVVLRHINDPIPDPLTVAPHRNIPAPLAAVTVKALAKRADDRYQTAEEMAEALLRAMHSSERPSHPELHTSSCRACGAKNPVTQRFCGACGARVTSTFSAPPAGKSAPPMRPSFLPPIVERPLVGRAEELSQIRGLLSEASDHLVWLHLTGENGAGKTRLLSEISKVAAEDGDVVVSATPHALRAPVPYEPVRALLAELLGVEPAALAQLADKEGIFAEPIVRAGVAEAADPQGLAGFEDRSRAGAVAAALSTAIRVAAGRAKSGRVVMIVDDLSSCDGLSQEVIERVAGIPDCSCLIATAGLPVSKRHKTVHTIGLHGLDRDAARRFMARERGGAAPDSSLSDTSRLMLPLYLEQVQALGAELGTDDSLPPRLADAVGQRIDGLELSARRIIQAAAVLGDRCGLDWLQQLTEGEDMSGLQDLHEQQLVRLTPVGLEFGHPFMRDLVEMSIPAEARRTLHERALQLCSEHSAPLEVRAEHAYRAGEPMSALMILERMGDVALGRGDAVAAVLAYRRALELGRREMLETGDYMLESAIVTFSRKLGEALEQRGDVAGADGVLREVLDLAGPHSIERARMLLALGRVASRRDRPRDAVRMLGQALEIAISQGEPVVEARVHIAMARLRREEGDNVGAANAFGRSLELLQGSAHGALRGRTLVEAGEVLVDVGDDEKAAALLEEALKLGEEGDSPALVAMATGALGAVHELRSDRGQAAARYREAARLAAEAGDAEGQQRWRHAAEALD